MILAAILGFTIVPGCVGPVTAGTSEADLLRALGPARVKSAGIEVGEGFVEPGTLIDGADASRALAILWRDPKTRVAPATVIICYGQSRGKCRWRTGEGITIGTPLSKIEALNRRPFRLLGFAWDYGGTVVSWSDGALQRWAGSGRLILRLEPDQTGTALPEYLQVQGDREFSSAHPAMRKLNPTVYQMILEFGLP